MVVAMFGVVVGVVGIAAVIKTAAGSFEEIVDCPYIHILRYGSLQRLFRWNSYQFCAIEGVQDNDFCIPDFHGISRTHSDTSLCGNAPFFPYIYTTLRPDKAHLRPTVLQHSSCHVNIHMIAMIMRGQQRVKVPNGKWVNDTGNIAQIGLNLLAANHFHVLVTLTHHPAAVGFLSGRTPEIHQKIGAVLRFQPNACAAQPPYSESARCDNLRGNLLIEPSTPFREGGENPIFPTDRIYIVHSFYYSQSVISGFPSKFRQQ